MSEISKITNLFNSLNCCVIIPTYNNASSIFSVVSSVLLHTNNVIVVNDGSTDETLSILKSISGIELISYSRNRGKGFALGQGFAYAYRQGYNYAITLDADGQHYASDLQLFLESIIENSEVLIIGIRTLKGTLIPNKSSFANKFSNFWFKFITEQSLSDTQCGYRLYPLKVLNEMHFYSTKYEFEIEILIRLAWKKVKIIPIFVNVFYPIPEERVTHFRPFIDFFRIGILYTVFVFIAILYIKPLHYIKNVSMANFIQDVKKNILRTNDSNKTIVLSVMLGIFMSIIPIWGYQLVTAIVLALFFKLNKIIVIVAANLSILPLMPFIIFLSFITGGLVLGIPITSFTFSAFSIEQMKSQIVQYLVGSIVLAIVASIVSGLITYLLLLCLRKKPIKKQ